jgi:hypothetical protein
MTEQPWKMNVEVQVIMPYGTTCRVKRTRGEVVEWYRELGNEWVSDKDKQSASVWFGVRQAEDVIALLLLEEANKAAWNQIPPFRQQITGWGIEDVRTLYEVCQ